MKRILGFLILLSSNALIGGNVQPDITYTKIEKLVDIKAVDEVTITYQYSAIVWNAMGAELSKLVVSYNKHSVIEAFEGAHYDMAGKKIRGVRSKEILDRPAYDGFTLFSDARIKSHQFNSGEYPYKVFYSFTIKLSHNMYGLSFTPRFDPSVSVDSFIGKLIFDKTLEPNYQLKGNKGMVERTEIKNKVHLSYIVTDLKALETEPYSPPFNSEEEGLNVFCNICSYAGYETNAGDWKGFGELIAKLNEGRDKLPIELVNKLKEITQNEDDTGKVRKVYEYLQNNSRYISVQVGIGGIQPIPAQEVYTTGYGDCKGLSNLMMSMLSALGIKSHYVLVEAGENPDAIDNSFVYDPFNHAILCVPTGNDTLWLECTSRFNPCGYQGSFTGNRKALIIEKGNSHLVSTSDYNHMDNLSTSRLIAKLETGGDLQVELVMRSENESQDVIRQLQYEVETSVRDRYWQQAFSIPSYVINKVEINSFEDKAIAEVKMNLTVNKAVANAGSRIFVQPVFTHTLKERMLKDTARVNDLYFNQAFTEIDTFAIAIQEGFRLESGGKHISMKTDFGLFELYGEENNGSYSLIRKRIQFRGTYDKSKYNDFVKFNNDMYQAERTKLVWVKK